MQVFYEEASGRVTAWHPEDTKRVLRPGEVKVHLGIKPPHVEEASVRDYICDGATLSLRPDFVAPSPPRDLKAEVDALEARIATLESG